ncbi:flagellar hook-basal body complex protein [Bombella saccharophila]|uniref:Flagellar hook protein FlgE n=1 Tax=Bombella saccharophila TaxID=2967338 RepID=A0ABT3W7B3_9PROT|nr:flagellar hook-basal body complex protein [Bombella saccharophila]MCX5614962.1 flagellar hook-basal body complex protein [Bombella saccharophila]PHI96336.1 flagellar biosynthesis protein FlgE [Parasaccharibacter apium]
MSGVFNALTTAVSGINAQSDAFTNLSNNIANSQTVGYKADTTSFADFVAGSITGNSASQAQSNTVQAITVQHVDNAGTATNSTNSLALDVSGKGMFVTSKPTGAGTANAGVTNFSEQKFYTRNGDFQQDKKGYLVNPAGYYLDGYMTDSTGALTNQLTQLNVSNVAFKPTTTTTMTLNAAVGKLPTDPANYTPQSYTTAPTTTYDASSNPHKIAVQWQQSDTNPLVWNVSAYDADGTGTIAQNNYQVTFDHSGSLASITDMQTGKEVGSPTVGSKAEIPVTAHYGNNEEQTINLSLGTIGGNSGTTMVTANNSASPNQANPLTLSGTQLSMSPTTLGTTTDSMQSYMTSPITVTTGSTTGQNSTSTTTQTPVAVQWTQTSASPQTWSVQAVDPYDSSTSSPVKMDKAHSVIFNKDGSIQSFDGQAVSKGSPVTANLTINGTNYSLDLSNASLTTGTTTGGDTTALTNDSITSGTYTGAAIESDGSVMAQFDNGYTQLIGKVALTNFNNVNGLQAVDGQAYLATSRSGTPQTGLVGENGTGSLAVGFVEASTTNLTGDLSALIVAQEAYSANTKIVTTADTLLQQTIAMKQ